MNILDLPSIRSPHELFETLVASDGILIERIISRGHTTPAGEWYDQERDEWVLLLQGDAVLAYDDGSLAIVKTGDYIFIPARKKHRVEFTSTEPPCIWLAVHANMQQSTEDEGKNLVTEGI